MYTWKEIEPCSYYSDKDKLKRLKEKKYLEELFWLLKSRTFHNMFACALYCLIVIYYKWQITSHIFKSLILYCSALGAFLSMWFMNTLMICQNRFDMHIKLNEWWFTNSTQEDKQVYTPAMVYIWKHIYRKHKPLKISYFILQFLYVGIKYYLYKQIGGPVIT